MKKVTFLIMAMVAMFVAVPKVFATEVTVNASDRVTTLGDKYYKMYYVTTDGTEYPVYVDGNYVKNSSNPEVAASIFYLSAADENGFYKISLAGTEKYWQFNLTSGMSDAAGAGVYQIFNSTVSEGNYWICGLSGNGDRASRATLGNANDVSLNFNSRKWNGESGIASVGQTAKGSWNSEIKLVEVNIAIISYVFKYNGETVATEAISVTKGDALPTPSFKAPFGLTYTAPTGTADKTAEYTIEVVKDEAVEFPFEFSESYDNAKWYTVKMRKGYIGFDGTNFPQAASETQPTAAKNMFAFVGTPFSFKVLDANEKNVYLKGNNNEVATETADGTSFYLYKVSNSTYNFAINGITGTVNDISGKMGFWASSYSYGDGGSQLFIDKAKDIQLYKVAFGENMPEGASVTLNGETVTPNSPVKAYALTSAPKAEDFTTAEIRYFKGEVTVTGNAINVNYITNRPAEWVTLGNLIKKAKAITLPTENFGTDPGFYSKDAVDEFPDAIEAAEAIHNFDYPTDEESIVAYNAAILALNAAIASVGPLMPEVGKVYQFINAFPGFEEKQGVRKAIYSDGSGLNWKNLNETDKSFYFTVDAVDGNNVTFKTYSDGKYFQAQNTNNQPIPVSDTENYCVLTSLGQGQFNILSNGSGAAFHAGGHSSGAGKSGVVCIWNGSANSCSAWYIHETTSIMDLVNKVDAAVTEAKAANTTAAELVVAATPTKVEWTTSTEQFSSNRPCPSEGSIDNLLDGNPATFFHSDWSGKFPASRYHELYVDGLDANVTEYDLAAMRRDYNGGLCANDNVLQMEVYGGTVEKPENRNTDGAVFTITSGEYPLAVLELPLDGLYANTSFDLGETGYEALCFRVTSTNGLGSEERAYFHFGEFHLYDHNRIVPAAFDVPAAYSNRVAAKAAVLEALLASPKLSAEYAERVEAATAQLAEAIEQAIQNENANKTFASSNKAKLQIAAGVKGSKGRASVDMPESDICAALGINSLEECKQLTIDGAAGYKQTVKAKYITETGYRDAYGKVCEKKDASLQITLNGGKFYVTPVVALEAEIPTINIYTVYTANEKAYLFLVTVNVVPAEGEGATAINGVDAKIGAAGTIYDLQGRKVSSVKKGQIYIVGGKKVMF